MITGRRQQEVRELFFHSNYECSSCKATKSHPPDIIHTRNTPTDVCSLMTYKIFFPGSFRSFSIIIIIRRSLKAIIPLSHAYIAYICLIALHVISASNEWNEKEWHHRMGKWDGISGEMFSTAESCVRMLDCTVILQEEMEERSN